MNHHRTKLIYLSKLGNCNNAHSYHYNRQYSAKPAAPLGCRMLQRSHIHSFIYDIDREWKSKYNRICYYISSIGRPDSKISWLTGSYDIIHLAAFYLPDDKKIYKRDKRSCASSGKSSRRRLLAMVERPLETAAASCA